MMHNTSSPDAAEIINAQGSGPYLLVCDHASRALPPEFDNLGLGEADLARHIAWDIGTADLTRKLSALLDAPAVLARWSRLLIDLNREAHSPTLIPDESDGTRIPGNRDLSPAERQRRVERYHVPFHDAVAGLVDRLRERGEVPLVVGVHSFTPVMGGTPRPWQVGLLWNRDPRLARAMIEGFQRRGLHAGDNEPYSGRHLFYTMDRHGAAHGFPQATLEIRQDELDNAEAVSCWADTVAQVLKEIAADPAIRAVRHFNGEVP